jgi:hypothetical protein
MHWQQYAIGRDPSDIELSTLITMAKKYNQEHPESSLDLNVYNDTQKLIFGLWNRQVNIPVLGLLSDKMTTLDSILRPCVDDEICNLDKNVLYLSYLHSDKIPMLLSYSLMLPKSIRDITAYPKMQRNLSKLNQILDLLGKVRVVDMYDLRKMLKGRNLNSIELCCLLWECQSRDLYVPYVSVRDFLVVNCGLNESDKM